MSTSTPIFSCQFWNIWVKQFGQFHFHSYIWYEMNEGLIILYWRQHLNLINLIDFRDQLNVALKTDYKYFLHHFHLKICSEIFAVTFKRYIQLVLKKYKSINPFIVLQNQFVPNNEWKWNWPNCFPQIFLIWNNLNN